MDNRGVVSVDNKGVLYLWTVRGAVSVDSKGCCVCGQSGVDRKGWCVRGC